MTERQLRDRVTGVAVAMAAGASSEFRRDLTNRLETLWRVHQNNPTFFLLLASREISDLTKVSALAIRRLLLTGANAAWITGAAMTLDGVPQEARRVIDNLADPISPAEVYRAFGNESGEPDELTRFPRIRTAASLIAETPVSETAWGAAASNNDYRVRFTVEGLEQDAATTVRDKLADVVESGPSLRKFKEEVSEAIDTSALGPGTLERVYRTNLQRAFRESSEAMVSAPGVADIFRYVIRTPIRDSRLTTLCAELSRSGIQGTGIFRIDDPTWKATAIPSHFNCVLPGTRVAVPGKVVATMKSFHRGPVIEIGFASGHRLAVTPNHPVLTRSGLVPARFLNKGSEVVRCPDAHRVFASVYPDNHDIPSLIEDVVASFDMAGEMCSGRVPSASEDFHGDGVFRDGDVDVVWSSRHLLSTLNSVKMEHGREFSFGHDDSGSVDFSSTSRLGQSFGGRGGTFRGFVGGRDLMGSLFGGHTGPFDLLCFRSSANRSAVFADNSIDYSTIYSELPRKRVARFAGKIPGNHPRFVREHDLSSGRFPRPLGTGGNSVVAEYSVQNDLGESVRVAQFANRFSGEVLFDDVTFVRYHQFRGHVYNLHCDPYHLYASDDIITGNCRCQSTPITIKQAARRGIDSASEWLETGEDPLDFVEFPSLSPEARKTWEEFRAYAAG